MKTCGGVVVGGVCREWLLSSAAVSRADTAPCGAKGEEATNAQLRPAGSEASAGRGVEFLTIAKIEVQTLFDELFEQYIFIYTHTSAELFFDCTRCAKYNTRCVSSSWTVSMKYNGGTNSFVYLLFWELCVWVQVMTERKQHTVSC